MRLSRDLVLVPVALVCAAAYGCSSAPERPEVIGARLEADTFARSRPTSRTMEPHTSGSSTICPAPTFRSSTLCRRRIHARRRGLFPPDRLPSGTRHCAHHRHAPARS
jgi:hypothetical protein